MKNVPVNAYPVYLQLSVQVDFSIGVGIHNPINIPVKNPPK